MSFEEWFEQYCEHDCPTEGYDDAKRTAKAAWEHQQKLITKPSELSTNICYDEVNALSNYMVENNAQLVHLHITLGAIGSTFTVSLVRKPETTKNITSYDWW